MEQFRSYPSKLKSFVVFKNRIVKSIRPSQSNVFDCDNHNEIRLITRLRVGMVHLCKDKFKHDFQDGLYLICSCGLDIKLTTYFLLHCRIINDERYTLLSTLNNIDGKLLELTNCALSRTLLHRNALFDNEKKHNNFNVTDEYILYTEGFEELLIY